MNGLLFTLRVDTAKVKALVTAPNDIERRPSLKAILTGIRDFCDAELAKLGPNENRDGGRPAHFTKASEN